jgi:metallo-beta-lactamase family protein
MRLSFLGGATTVTGSQYLLDTDDARVLIDCGMFQGSPNETVRNRLPFAYDPKEIDALLLTHAHLDHCGLVPHLVANGFGGPIHMTSGTVELAGLVLLDAAKLQTEFSRRAARRSRHHHHLTRDAEAELRSASPEVAVESDEPLYTEAETLAAIRQFKATRYDSEFPVAKGVTARFVDAGHILGSAIIVVRAGGRTLVFSGDIGRRSSPIIRDPTLLTDADYVLIESTYGGREHEPEDEAIRILAETVQMVSDAGGVLLVPSFAIGRTQEIVYELDRLLEAGTIPQLPLYLDSPMASKASDIYRRHADYFDDDTRRLLESGDTPLDYPNQTVTRNVQDSQAIAQAPRPYMIVASNGMLTGGRVLGHLRNLIDDPLATILFVGYQGEGTLGAHLQAGATTVKLDGQLRDVRCKIRSISGFSAHADEGELLDWLRHFGDGRRPGDPGFPRMVFLVHGDPEAQIVMEPKVQALGFTTKIPRWREVVTLD